MKKRDSRRKGKHPVSIRPSSSQWTSSLFIVSWLAWLQGLETLVIPIFLSYSWIVVTSSIASTVVAISVVVEAPWSFLWSIHGPLAFTGFDRSSNWNYFRSICCLCFPSPVFFKSDNDSLSQAYNRDGFDYGLLTWFIAQQVNGKDLSPAMWPLSVAARN